MLKKFLLALPPVIFLSVIVGVYSIWQIVPTPTPTTPNDASTPTRDLTSTNTPTALRPPNTPPLPTPSQTPKVKDPTSPLPPSTPTPIDTPKSSSSVTPAFTVVPLYGMVIPEYLNVREGPSIYYSLVGGLEKGDKVIILRRTPKGDWLEIRTPEGRVGWVAAQQIKIPATITAIALIPTATVGPTPTPGSSTTIPTASNPPPIFDLRGGSISGKIEADQEQWYTFSGIGSPTTITLMFRPNVNFYADNFLGYNLQFFVYTENQIPFWYPGDPDVSNLGVGDHDPDDRDGDLGSGELIWDGARLSSDQSFYLRIVNQSDKPIRYCLSPEDEYQWNCSPN